MSTIFNISTSSQQSVEKIINDPSYPKPQAATPEELGLNVGFMQNHNLDLSDPKTKLIYDALTNGEMTMVSVQSNAVTDEQLMGTVALAPSMAELQAAVLTHTTKPVSEHAPHVAPRHDGGFDAYSMQEDRVVKDTYVEEQANDVLADAPTIVSEYPKDRYIFPPTSHPLPFARDLTYRRQFTDVSPEMGSRIVAPLLVNTRCKLPFLNKNVKSVMIDTIFVKAPGPDGDTYYRVTISPDIAQWAYDEGTDGQPPKFYLDAMNILLIAHDVTPFEGLNVHHFRGPKYDGKSLKGQLILEFALNGKLNLSEGYLSVNVTGPAAEHVVAYEPRVVFQ